MKIIKGILTLLPLAITLTPGVSIKHTLAPGS